MIPIVCKVLYYIGTCIICNIQSHKNQFFPAYLILLCLMSMHDLRAPYLYVYADIIVLKCICIHAYRFQLLLTTTPDEPHSSTHQLDDLCWGTRCVCVCACAAVYIIL